MDTLFVSVALFLAAYSLMMAGVFFAAAFGKFVSGSWNPNSSQMAGRPPVLGAPPREGEDAVVAPRFEGTASDIESEFASGD